MTRFTKLMRPRALLVTGVVFLLILLRKLGVIPPALFASLVLVATLTLLVRVVAGVVRSGRFRARGAHKRRKRLQTRLGLRRRAHPRPNDVDQPNATTPAAATPPTPRTPPPGRAGA